jgi:hypothetical protein
LRYQTAVRDHLRDDPSVEAQIEKNVQRLEQDLQSVLSKYEALKTTSNGRATLTIQEDLTEHAAAGMEVLAVTQRRFCDGRQVFTEKLIPPAPAPTSCSTGSVCSAEMEHTRRCGAGRGVHESAIRVVGPGICRRRRAGQLPIAWYAISQIAFVRIVVPMQARPWQSGCRN